MIDKKIVCAFDIHYPFHDKKSIKILLDVIKDFEPDTFVFGGDQLDLSCVSTYSNGKPRKVANKSLFKDYNGFVDSILNPIESVLQNKAEKVFIYGNHCNRIQLYLDYYPQTQGIIEIEHNIDLSDWKIIPYNNYYKVSKDTIVLHGLYHNEYHSKKHLDVFGCNVYYGHIHSHQVYSRQTPLNKKPLKATSIGCLSTLNPEYAKDKPNSWCNQFLVLYKNDGIVYDDVITIQKGKTIFEGKVYE